MTAFAQIVCQIDSQQLQVRLKSVNHRQLKYHIFAGSYTELEAWATKELQETFERGHIELHIELQADHQDEVELKQWINRCQKQGLPTPNWSDLYAKRNSGLAYSLAFEDSRALQLHITDAITLPKSRRLEEGKAMIKYMLRDTETLDDLLEQINEELPKHHQNRIDRFKQKLNQFLETINSSTHEDLSRECAHLLEKLDVQEEYDRLNTHLKRLKRSLKEDHRGGKYLDFLCQEIHREITTLGNKSQSAFINEWVVSFKTNLEKLREQCQNLE